MRAATLGLLLVLFAVSARAQTPGYIVQNAQTPILLLPRLPSNGVMDQFVTTMALERFNGSTWVELLTASGARASLSEGGCWQVPDRSRALGYRIRPQVASPGGTPVPVDCASPLPYFAAPACPSVVNALSPASYNCVSWTPVVDPGGALLGRPLAPVVQ